MTLQNGAINIFGRRLNPLSDYSKLKNGLRGESSIAPNRTLRQNQLTVVGRLGY